MNFYNLQLEPLAKDRRTGLKIRTISTKSHSRLPILVLACLRCETESRDWHNIHINSQSKKCEGNLFFDTVVYTIARSYNYYAYSCVVGCFPQAFRLVLRRYLRIQNKKKLSSSLRSTTSTDQQHMVGRISSCCYLYFSSLYYDQMSLLSAQRTLETYYHGLHACSRPWVENCTNPKTLHAAIVTVVRRPEEIIWFILQTLARQQQMNMCDEIK